MKVAFKAQTKKSHLSKPVVGATKSSAFDVEEEESGPQASTSKATTSSKAPAPQVLSRITAKRQKEAEEIDSNVFKYDEVYDDMKEAIAKQKEAKEKSLKEGGPKYAQALVDAAEKRKIDRLRAEDKMLQREREKEGGAFSEKDAFVTPAYLKLREEMEKAEEEEKQKEARNAALGISGSQRFYAKYLGGKEDEHAAAMAAADAAAGKAKSDEVPLEEEKELTEEQIAAAASKELGRKIETNESGEIIDKRDMLAGGLNLGRAGGTSSSKRPSTFSKTIAERNKARAQEGGAAELDEGELSAALRGRAARQRLSQMAQKQLLEWEENKRKKEEEETEEVKVKLQKRNNESKVEEMKRLAKERREKREKEANQAI
ncbi:hypothetical protein BT69DRAFT_1351490 [Atractiella rhizophila]|nr:hypothetical protein BT69DRAFT_1351490 [Atractiella rhizophila]